MDQGPIEVRSRVNPIIFFLLGTIKVARAWVSQNCQKLSTVCQVNVSLMPHPIALLRIILLKRWVLKSIVLNSIVLKSIVLKKTL